LVFDRSNTIKSFSTETLGGFSGHIVDFRVGMCIMEHLEIPENSGICISNSEYRILFRNNLLGAK